MCVHMCMVVCVETTVCHQDIRKIPQSLSSLFIEVGSLTGPGAHPLCLTGWQQVPRTCLSLTSSSGITDMFRHARLEEEQAFYQQNHRPITKFKQIIPELL